MAYFRRGVKIDDAFPVAKWSVLFQQGANGWSETVFLRGSVSTTDREAFASVVEKYIDQRRTMLPTSVRAVGARYQLMTSDVAPSLYLPPDVKLGTGRRAGDPASPNEGFTVLFVAGGAGHDAKRAITGWLNSDVPGLYTTAGVFNDVPATPKGLIAGLRSIMIASHFTGTGGSVRFVLPTMGKNVNVNPRFAIRAIGVNTDGYLQVTISTTEGTPFGVTDSVQVSVTRKRCVRGLSGPARVTNVVVGSVATDRVFTLDKKPCCGSGGLTGVTGTIAQQYMTFNNITDVAPDHVGYRQRGRAFFVSRGRRAGKCC